MIFYTFTVFDDTRIGESITEFGVFRGFDEFECDHVMAAIFEIGIHDARTGTEVLGLTCTLKECDILMGFCLFDTVYLLFSIADTATETDIIGFLCLFEEDRILTYMLESIFDDGFTEIEIEGFYRLQILFLVVGTVH